MADETRSAASKFELGVPQGTRGENRAGVSKPPASSSIHSAATTLCMTLIDTRPPGAGGSELAPCKLDDGHDGPHEPMHPDAVKMLRLQAFLGQRGIGV